MLRVDFGGKLHYVCVKSSVCLGVGERGRKEGEIKRGSESELRGSFVMME